MNHRKQYRIKRAKIREIIEYDGHLDEETLREHLQHIPGWLEMPVSEVSAKVHERIAAFMIMYRQLHPRGKS